mmetsp:Transcript_43811/g.115814  ORF Transcript_43811/g.115814 Transcript_43811/m.115814 type:complete len:230 (-) Transcript_43811:646-1335(-)
MGAVDKYKVAEIPLASGEIRQRCDKASKSAESKFRRLLEANDPRRERVWDDRYKFFSNKRTKDVYHTFEAGLNDPLRSTTPVEEHPGLPAEHQYYFQETSGWRRFPDTADAMRRLNNPDHPNGFKATMQRCQQYVEHVKPRELWAKHHFFSGGCNLTDSYKIYCNESPRLWLRAPGSARRSKDSRSSRSSGRAGSARGSGRGSARGGVREVRSARGSGSASRSSESHFS